MKVTIGDVLVAFGSFLMFGILYQLIAPLTHGWMEPYNSRTFYGVMTGYLVGAFKIRKMANGRIERREVA